jgi:hypothetical protein
MEQNNKANKDLDADPPNASNPPITNNTLNSLRERILPLCPPPVDQSSPPSHHDNEEEDQEQPQPYNIHLDEYYDNLYDSSFDSDFDPAEFFDPNRTYTDWQRKILYERCMDSLCSAECDHMIRYVYVYGMDEGRKSDDEEEDGEDEGEYQENVRYNRWLETRTGEPMGEEGEGQGGDGYGEQGGNIDDEE